MCVHSFSDLDYNKLSSLRAELFDKLANLQVLSIAFSINTHCSSDLDYNELSYLPAGLFDNLVNLQVL